jgi:hypothetical protein
MNSPVRSMLKTSIIALTAALTQVGCMAPAEEGEWSEEELGQVQEALSGTYEIKPVHSNKCVDVSGVSTADGANIHQWDCVGGANQKWTLTNLGGTLHEVKSVHSGKVMDADTGSTNVHQWTNYASGNQKWYFEGSGPYTIKPADGTGQCLDVAGSSTGNGANVQTVGCTGGNNQRFNVVSSGGGAPPPSASWHDDFFDGFDGTWLNTGNWNVIVGTDGEFNNEAQWYVNEQGVENNYWVSDGTLKIKVQKENRTFAGRTKNYTSTRLSTKDKREFQNGAWESRLIFWAGNGADGVWPAFWLLGWNINEAPNPGPTCWPLWGAREIDIFEFTMNNNMLPNQSSIITNFIQGSQCQQGQGNRGDVGVNPYAWHTYRVEFFGGEAKIFIDGVWRRSVNDDPWQDQAMFALLNVAIGGNFGGAIAWGSSSYAGMTVDYVKHQSWY